MRSSIKRIVRELAKSRRDVPDGVEFRRQNIAITGPGRSGTTLTCHLLNKLGNTVALSEPIAPGKFADRMPDHEAVCDGVEDFYRQMREMALSRGTVISKHVGGMVPDNSKGMVGGVRKRIAEKGKIAVNKDLSPDFYLAIKSVGMFTALLPTLTNRFHSFAIVRNPSTIRASVASVKSNNKARKNPPSLVRYDPDMNTALRNSASANTDPVEKWLLRMDYIFQRYAQELPAENVIRYEDIVSSGGKALQVIVPEAAQLDEPLDSKNLNSVYDRDVIRRHGERLLKSEGAYWNFYSREDVEEILDGLG